MVSVEGNSGARRKKKATIPLTRYLCPDNPFFFLENLLKIENFIIGIFWEENEKKKKYNEDALFSKRKFLNREDKIFSFFLYSYCALVLHF